MGKRHRGFNQIGIEPAFAARLRHLNRGFGIPMETENLQRLRQVHDARKQRNLAAPKPIRISTAVPVFVEAMDGLRDRLRKTDSARNRCAPFTTDLDQFAGLFLLFCGYPNQCANSFQERRPGGDMSHRVLQTFPAHACPVRQFDVALGSYLVRRDNVKQFGRVAAASGVFQQKSVEEIGLICVGNPDVTGQAHAENAGAHGMAHGPAFGQIESIRQGGNDLRNTNGRRGLFACWQ